MSDKRLPPRAPSTLSFKIGNWAEASATGWGVVALVILGLLFAAFWAVGRPY